MKFSIGITRSLMSAALVGLIVLAGLGFRAHEKDLEGLRESSQESIFWDASQSEAELARFVSALGRYALGDDSVTSAEVNERFDILWSRVALFQQGEVGRRIARYDEERRVVRELRNLLKKYDETIVNLSRPVDEAKIETILAEFTAAGERLRALSVDVLQSEEIRMAGVREHVRTSARLTWLVSMAALILALLLIGVMLIETRRYRRMADESADLASRAEAASRAKSRFLTMMSHELRTPMNGVLGLLALVRQTPLTDRQLRLVERAEQSGRQMSTLLDDILDFSDLQNREIAANRDMFEISSLMRAVEDSFGPIIQREGVALRIKFSHDLPRWVVGDFARLRQAVGHFIVFFVDYVGSKDVRLTGRPGPHGPIFEIDAAVRERDMPGWQPESIFDGEASRDGDFASQALGSTIGRGLVDLMSGSIELRRAEGRAKLSIWVPLEALDGGTKFVRIEADSVSIQTVLGALVRGLGYDVWEPGLGICAITAVLLEAGGDDEMARTARLRAEHPATLLVAIGEPKSGHLFDAVCNQPVTGDSLGNILRSRERGNRAVM